MKLLIVIIALFWAATIFAENNIKTNLSDTQIASLVKYELTKDPSQVKQFVRTIIFLYPDQEKIIIKAAITTPGINPADVLSLSKVEPKDPPFFTNKPLVDFKTKKSASHN